MRVLSRFKYSRALPAFMGILLIFLITANVLIVSQQRTLLLEEVQKHMESELSALGTFLREPLLRQDYAEVKQFLVQWAEEHDEIIEFKAIMPNDFVLVEYNSRISGLNTYYLERKVRYAGNDLITLKVVRDFSLVENILSRLRLQLITGSFILTLILGTVLWFTIKKMALMPLQQEIAVRREAEEMLQKAKDELEIRVHERTKKLNEINTDLLQEIAGRRKIEKERERLNAELALKNKELEQIIYASSHDLRTPLVNIHGFSKELNNSVNELLSVVHESVKPEDVRKRVDSIVEKDIPESLKYITLSISKMDTLLNGILKLSRLGRDELEIEQIDMNRLLSDAASIFEFKLKERNVKMEFSELPACRGDEIQLNQVFSNLLENALKYLGNNKPGIIKVSGKKEDGQSVYCVQDNGIGITPENQEKVFEIFHQIEPGNSSGEGLGLSIVRRIVQRHQGKIWIESEPGRGSRFFISLPGVN